MFPDDRANVSVKWTKRNFKNECSQDLQSPNDEYIHVSGDNNDQYLNVGGTEEYIEVNENENLSPGIIAMIPGKKPVKLDCGLVCNVSYFLNLLFYWHTRSQTLVIIFRMMG